MSNVSRRSTTWPVILVEGNTLAESWHNAMVACYTYGGQIETPKQREGMLLGCDAKIVIVTHQPHLEPKIHKRSFCNDARGILQYTLEVVHGIHDHWLKCTERPEWWGYTYHARYASQVADVLRRIKYDWDEKGRITGRDYQFTLWRPEEDIILEQEDPPCWQRGVLRFMRNEGTWVLNYITYWRSRDLAKAWNDNCIAQIELQRLFALKISDMLGIPVVCGAYIDSCTSLHIYGKYLTEESLAATIEMMKRVGYQELAMNLNDFMGDITSLKRLIAAQIDLEAIDRAQGASENDVRKNLGAAQLESLGYDLDTFSYPQEWDSWPKQWDEV